MRYLGGRKGGFRMKGPYTGTVYCIPGTGMTFYADPQDILGVDGKNGLCALKEYELVT